MVILKRCFCFKTNAHFNHEKEHFHHKSAEDSTSDPPSEAVPGPVSEPASTPPSEQAVVPPMEQSPTPDHTQQPSTPPATERAVTCDCCGGKHCFCCCRGRTCGCYQKYSGCNHVARNRCSY